MDFLSRVTDTQVSRDIIKGFPINVSVEDFVCKYIDTYTGRRVEWRLCLKNLHKKVINHTVYERNENHKEKYHHKKVHTGE